MCEGGVLLDGFADLVSAEARHDDVRQHDIRLDLPRLDQGIVAIIRRNDFDVFVGE